MMPSPGLTFFLQGLGALLFLSMLYHGSPSEWLVVLAVYFLGSCVGNTMTFHRLLAHRSWKAPRWFEVFGTLCKTVMVSGSSVVWVATHRAHHRHSDQELDPHDPRKLSTRLYGYYAHRANLLYARELMKDGFHVFAHKCYWAINATWALIVVLAFGDLWALAYAWLVPAAISFQMSAVVISLNHTFGYRRYETKDRSTNHPLTALLVWGEGWHNNHHAEPHNPYFSRRWFELDIGGLLIRGLRVG